MLTNLPLLGLGVTVFGTALVATGIRWTDPATARPGAPCARGANATTA